jgi:hypothetical protein
MRGGKTQFAPDPETIEARRLDGRGRDAHTPKCAVERSAVVSTAGTRASSPKCDQLRRLKFVDVLA